MGSQRAAGVIVTGAAGVIGRACCRRLVDAGHRVVAVDSDGSAGRQLLEDLAVGDLLCFVQADVADATDTERYVTEGAEALGGIDGFVNNAAIEGAIAPLISYPIDVFDRVVAVNLRGVFLGLQRAMAAMAATGGGSIVNVASVAGLVGFTGLSPYVATKHAVVGLTKTAAVEGARHGVRVNAVCPGAVESRMMEVLENGLAAMLGLPDGQVARRSITGSVPERRYAAPAEVANAVAYLLSDESSYITGAVLPVDGGYTSQ